MRNFFYAGLAGAVLLSVDLSAGAVNFAEFSVTQVISPEVLAEAIGTTETAHLAGVATYPAVNGPVYVAQSTGPGDLHVLRADVNAGSAVRLTHTAQIALDLGAPYVQAFGLQAGFAYSVFHNKIYVTDSLNGAGGVASLLSINATSGYTSLVSRTTETALLVDYAINANGEMVASHQSNESAVLGIVSTSDGQWAAPVSETLFSAAAGSAEANLVPGAVGVSAVTDDVYFFCGGENLVFHVDGLGDSGPTVTLVAQPEFSGAQITDITSDDAGNMFAYDAGGDQILILRKLDGAVFAITMEQIGADQGEKHTPGNPVPFRGLAARKAGRGQSDLFIGTTAESPGLLRVRFGNSSSEVNAWELY